MIRVTVELWPFGWETNKRTIAVLDVYNDGTGTPERGNYKFRVYRRPGVKRPLSAKGRSGEVKNYPRQAYPVWELIRRVLNEARGRK